MTNFEEDYDGSLKGRS